MIAAHGYPRPQVERAEWTSLNGAWDFALDPDARWTTPGQVIWDATIQVPFSPETPASGIGDTGLYRACWYRRTFRAPDLADGERQILRFGAVDYAATVWVNGVIAARHEGGYTPFSADVTALLDPLGPQTIVVRAEDDSQDLAKPRGKQDWLPEPHSVWYPRTTGIWQTVWLERLPATSIAGVRWIPNVEQWEIGLEVVLDGEPRDDLRLEVRLFHRDRLLVDDRYAVVAGEVHRRIALADGGVEDYRSDLLWSPTCPTLIRARLELRTRDGDLIDAVDSYTALRSVGVHGDRFMLNGRPYPLRLVLDQGYWPESGLTAPDDAALRRDVELAKAMGFSGVRKHQKIEDPRYLYWADTLGLLVWAEMPSAYRFNTRSVTRVTREWTEAIERDVSHPCIVAWVPFNESWGVPDMPAIAAQRHYVQAIYHLTRTLDPTRPVVGNDGWESTATDVIGVHDYDADPERLARRYAGGERLPELLARERPGGRVLTIDGHPHAGQPIMLTEFGGIAYSGAPAGSWGYSAAESTDELADEYARLLGAVRSLPLLAGFCYTQFADTYQESNGLLYADRTPKIPLETIALATRGPRCPADEVIEREWRKRMMKYQRTCSVEEADAIPEAMAAPA